MRGQGASIYCRRSSGTWEKEENREKVRCDKEVAARDEQLKREQSHRRDAEFHLERLRQARGLPSSSSSAISGAPSSDSPHINLFNGLADFSSLGGAREESTKYRKDEAEDGGSKKSKKQRREERPPALSPDDEKYKLRYGLAGKGVKAPWYLSMPSSLSSDDVEGEKREGHLEQPSTADSPTEASHPRRLPHSRRPETP